MADMLEKSIPIPERAPVTPEKKEHSEHTPSREGEKKPAAHESEPAHLPPVHHLADPAPAGASADPLTESIERILSEDLVGFYGSMPPNAQVAFKKKGDETVGRLRTLMTHTHLKIKEVIRLIVNWLKMIPGVNRFFLEQESKIKADKIIELHKRAHGV